MKIIHRILSYLFLCVYKISTRLCLLIENINTKSYYAYWKNKDKADNE